MKRDFNSLADPAISTARWHSHINPEVELPSQYILKNRNVTNNRL